MIKSGNTTIDPIAVKDLSKDEFYEIVKGKIADDFDSLWIKVCKANGNNIAKKIVEDESSSKLSKSNKKS